MTTALDTIATDAWLRNESDAKAVHAGHRFNLKRGAYTVWWIERYCTLYEGAQWAGQPMRMHGAKTVDDDFPIDRSEEWFHPLTDEENEAVVERALARAVAYQEHVAANGLADCDWQYDFAMRFYGWECYSDFADYWVRRFRRGNVWIAKKNKKSPTLAALGLYQTCGDGEQGNHVFFGAKDGTQARKITGEHAVAMYQQSEELQSILTLNKNLMRLSHAASLSYMEPLSSSNVRTHESKEGLNGDLLIDETHVVDRDFVNRLTRMGISRTEPIHLEFSTGGDDPDCYGKEQHDIGEDIVSGKLTNHRRLHINYSVPAKLTDEELAADPLRYGCMANPSMGQTIDPAEFLADYHTSRAGSKRAFSEFRMYRLNVWQQSHEAWLTVDQWNRGRRDFTEAAFYGCPCWAALDLGRSRDLTALCLGFPGNGEEISLLWWFWLPEQYARDNADKAPFLEFANDPACNFFLVPGDTMQMGYLLAECRRLDGLVKVQELVYDDWNAEETTKQLSEGIADAAGNIIIPGLGWPRHPFSQNIRQFNEPTKEFEKRVLEGKILHNGDPCMEWQIQHGTLREDGNGNIKPMKPSKDSVRKVDGLVTGIMAMQRVIAGRTTKRVHIAARRGLLTT